MAAAHIVVLRLHLRRPMTEAPPDARHLHTVADHTRDRRQHRPMAVLLLADLLTEHLLTADLHQRRYTVRLPTADQRPLMAAATAEHPGARLMVEALAAEAGRTSPPVETSVAVADTSVEVALVVMRVAEGAVTAVAADIAEGSIVISLQP